ncbi:MAG TPA: adenosine deaminase [Candidatus Cloacimonadota bacterium]|jgi:adenosine deaminase|nr:adenosine deaminase [Candidatus Cloacimonadales bacterium]HPK40050.1 adenosine deaminase [Candidatus Cloacimonadota bacterium]HPY96993.1 adenosine deaminase [Candidatus Cloacimonadota bacterium]HQB41705.1 adenosine deaminase [Candidatus Cloacimonadota bacterium]
MSLKRSFIHKLPKTDLHLHLDGSLRMSTIFDLAKKQNVELPAKTEEELKKMIACTDTCASLEQYLKAFDITLSVMQTEEALYRVAFELAEDCAAENIRYIEVRYSPILHTNQGLKLTQISDAVIAGLKDAEKKFNIKTGVIICGIRNMSPEISLKLAELAVAYKNKGVVAFDLAGAEYNHPAKEHKEAFDLALHNNLNITIHAGEAYGPESISQALHSCGAHRIGHGTRLLEDRDLLNYVNDHRIPLEICVKSNFHTKAVNSIESHPLNFYLNYGLRVTLNTDNRMVSDTTMTDEYMLVIESLHLTYQDVKTLIINGFKSAFIPYKERVNLLNTALQEIEELEEKELKEK